MCMVLTFSIRLQVALDLGTGYCVTWFLRRPHDYLHTLIASAQALSDILPPLSKSWEPDQGTGPVTMGNLRRLDRRGSGRRAK
jgi:hypothetical protein